MLQVPTGNGADPASHAAEMIAAAREQVEEVLPSGDGTDALRLCDSPIPEPGDSQAPATDSFPGYQILRRIHHGGQGVVFQALQKGTKRKVAIKVMKEGPFASRRDKARFEREVEILGQLSHPSIVAIHDSGTAAGNFYFVMDYISGQPLDAWMAGSRRSIEETLRLVRKIAEAVNAAHLRGVVHRDLKPGNIRIDADGEPHILDFGLAKVATPIDASMMTVTGQFVGSLPWASPEQAEGVPGKIDIRTDVYSLGVILYQLLTGRFPYDVVGSMRDVLDRILKAEPVQPSTLRKEINDEVETIVLKCLNKERERRYQSAGELARDIGHYLNGEPIEAKRDSTLYVLRKNLRRHKTPVLVVAGFLMLIMVSLVIATGLWHRAASARDHAIMAERQQNLERERALLAENAALLDRDRAEAAEREARTKAQQLRSTAYAARIASAAACYDAGQLQRTIEFLYTCPADLRGWEWYRLVWCSDRALLTLRGHTGKVRCLAWSPDGQRIVSGAEDGALKLWDALTGEESTALAPPAPPSVNWPSLKKTMCVSFSPDGKRIASGTGNGRLKLWDGVSGSAVVIRVAHRGALRSIAFSADGRWLATSGDDGAVKVWDVIEGIEHEHHDVPMMSSQALVFGPDGPRVAGANADKTIRVWDSTTPAAGRLLGQQSDAVACTAFTSDSTGVIVGQIDGTIRVLDASTGDERFLLHGHGGKPTCLALAQRANRLVCGSEQGNLEVWDPSQPGAVTVLRGHEGGVLAVAVSPDGKWIASASADRTIRIWDASASPEPRIIATGIPLSFCIALSSDGRRIAMPCKDGIIRIRDTMSGGPISELRGHSNTVFSVAFSPDNQVIASGGKDGTIRLWDLQDPGDPFVLREGTAAVRAVVFSPDGKKLVSSHFDPRSTLVVWDVATRQKDRAIPADMSAMNYLAMSPDGERVAAGSWSGEVYLWRISTGARLRVWRAHSSPVSTVAFSPDGAHIASGCADGGLKIWNAQTGELSAALTGSGEWVRAVFGHDGNRLFSGGSEGTVRVWDVSTGTEMLALRGRGGPVGSLAIDPQEKLIVTASPSGTLVLWEAASRAQVENSLEAAERLARGAAVLLLQNQHQEAEALLRESLEMHRRILGDSHARTRQVMARLGMVLARSRSPDRYAEAGSLLSGAGIAGDPGGLDPAERMAALETLRWLYGPETLNWPDQLARMGAEAIAFESVDARLFDLGMQTFQGPRAAIDYARSIRSVPDTEHTRYFWAHYLLLGDEGERAAAAIRRAIELDGERPPYCLVLGMALLKCGKVNEAREMFAKVLADIDTSSAPLPPDATLPHWTAAYFLDLVTQDQYTEKASASAAGGEPPAWIPWYYVGWRNEHEGRRDDAIAAYRKSVDLGEAAGPYSTHHWAAYRLGRLTGEFPASAPARTAPTEP